MGRRRHSRQQRRHPARQDLRQNGPRRFRTRAESASSGLGDLHQGGLGGDARAQLRARAVHVLGLRRLRQFRPGQLWRGEGRHDRPDERAASRRRQEQHPRQYAAADGGDRHDRRADPGRNGRADEPGDGDPGGALSGQRGRAFQGDSRRRRRRLRRHPYRGDRWMCFSPRRSARRRRSPRASPRSPIPTTARPLDNAFGQTFKFVEAAARALGVKLPQPGAR